MDDKFKWELKQVQKETADNSKEITALKEWKGDMDTFKASLVEKLVTIFKRLDSIEDTNKWVNRTALGTLATGVMAVIGALIMWLVQK